MPGYWTLQQQYGPELQRGVQMGASLADMFIAARDKRKQESQLAEAQKLADQEAMRQADAAARERQFQAGIMSGEPIRAESAMKAYREQNPIGALQFERALQGEPGKGPELDPIGKRVILESNYRPATPEFQRRYSELAAEQDKSTKYSAGADYASKLRTEFQALPQVKSFAEASAGYEKLSNATPTAAGDLATVFGFMKILDPGSSVREGEQADARNAAGVPERIKNTYNLLLSGERLTPEQRVDFRNNAKVFYGAHQRQYDALAKRYAGLAIRGNVDPSDVVLKIYGVPQSAPLDYRAIAEQIKAKVIAGEIPPEKAREAYDAAVAEMGQ